MKRFYVSALVLATIASVCLGAFAAAAAPSSEALPSETTFRPGPGVEVARANCTGCHSADYISTQPRGPKFKDEFWKAEVNKMIKVYGAPIDDGDIAEIVDYLAKAYAD
jgi:sulfite dehydrogenase (cytochrome) subunit B